MRKPRVAGQAALSQSQGGGLPTDPDERWKAVLNRDPAADGRFFFGVVTTGVFCRPSCAARRPLRRNVRFYPTPAAARADLLRPCLRCRPEAAANEGPGTQVEAVCRFIRKHCDSGESLTLERLAGVAGMSPSHFGRTFRGATGVTPRQFVEACRIDTFKRELRGGAAVTDAVYSAGFGSASRLYDKVDRSLGMKPGEYRAGGREVAISYALTAGPLGRMLLGATDRGICCVEFGESDPALIDWLRREYPAAALQPMRDPPAEPFATWMRALSHYLEDAAPVAQLPLAARATAFQLQVWNFLRTIPRGDVRSYGEVAGALGRQASARAVARACAANRVALLIPCHRVIRGDGQPGGYRWGVERKRLLLEMERGGRAPSGPERPVPRLRR
jgi:AraC family transcriptional regulator of adaptative response/methylated-DNA-[protein]-cysteine methyltransferase